MYTVSLEFNKKYLSALGCDSTLRVLTNRDAILLIPTFQDSRHPSPREAMSSYTSLLSKLLTRMDSCPICAESYYKNDADSFAGTASVSGTADDSIRCQYICDSGEQCKLSQSVDGDFCSLHVQQRVGIKCLHCQKDCCKICYRRFFLQQLEEPFCMHCKKGFDLEFLLGYDENQNQRFTRSFIWGPWKEHREDVLLDQIMARMPEFQPKASAEVKLTRARDLYKRISDRIRQLTMAKTPLFKKLSAYKDIRVSDPVNFPYVDQLQELEEKVGKYDQRINKLRVRFLEIKKEVDNERFMVQNGRYAENDQEVRDAKAAKAAETHIYRGKCPKDNCNGFIEDKWACGMCGDKICSKCMMPKDKEHKCKEADVESVNYLREQRKAGETKPCPACRNLVSRVSGCNQMWCISCHTFFDWAKGTIIKNTSYVHNPEHDEWVRQHGGVLGNDLNFAVGVGICGLSSADIYALPNLRKRDSRILAEILRSSNEIRDELAGYIDPLEHRVENTCIEFLKGKLTRSGLKTLIQQHYKASKKAELANARRTMFADTVQQMLRVAIEDVKKDQEKGDVIVQRTAEAVQSLRDYTEKCMRTIGVIFNSQAPHLSEIQFKKERNDSVHIPKKMVSLVEKVHERRYYPNWMNRDLQVIYDDNREAWCILTGTVNQFRFMKYLKNNREWKTTVTECVKAIKESKRVGYKSRHKPRRWLNSQEKATLSVKRFQQLSDQEPLRGKCIMVRESYEDDLMESNRFCRNSSNSIFCASCQSSWGFRFPADLKNKTWDEALDIKFDDDDSDSDSDSEEPSYEQQLNVALQASLNIA